MKEKERRKIYDVAVNRVDGVTEPSTGRSFLLMKSASESQNSTASQRLIDSATSVIDSFTKEQVELTKDQAESIQSLAGAVGVDLKLSESEEDNDEEDEEEEKESKKVKKESKSSKSDDEEDEDKEEDKGKDGEEVKKTQDDYQVIDVNDFESVLRKMIGPMLHEEIKKMANGEYDNDSTEAVKKSADEEDESYERVSSNRLKGQDSFKKAKGEPSMDEGLFEDIIFE